MENKKLGRWSQEQEGVYFSLVRELEEEEEVLLYGSGFRKHRLLRKIALNNRPLSLSLCTVRLDSVAIENVYVYIYIYE